MGNLQVVCRTNSVKKYLSTLHIDADQALLLKAINRASAKVSGIYREVDATIPVTYATDQEAWELFEFLAAAEYQQLIADTEESHRVARRNIEAAVIDIKTHLGINTDGTGPGTGEVTTPNAYTGSQLDDIV